MNWEFKWLWAIQRHRSDRLDGMMKFLSLLGNFGVFWIGLGAMLMVPRKHRRTGTQVLIAIAVTFLVGNLAVKTLVDRTRPYQARDTLIPLIRPPFDSSFPSGHTMNGFTAAVSIFFRNRKMGVPALFLASGIAFSRMYNLVHYPTDVFGGMLLGIMVAAGVDRFMDRRDLRRAA